LQLSLQSINHTDGLRQDVSYEKGSDFMSPFGEVASLREMDL